MHAFLKEAGLVSTDDYWAEPLTGGVASDIWKIVTTEKVVVVKRALARLRVSQVWEAPVSRNASEVEWMLEAARIAPEAVPTILAHDPGRNMYAMSYLDPISFPVWKQQLRNGPANPAFAAQIASVLAQIHSETAGRRDIAARFANDDVFFQLRIEPYLEAVARVHEDLRVPIAKVVDSVTGTKQSLVHGDISPKNILCGPDGPIILDAECAWYGEPAFDLAFCLNHLLLKCLWAPTQRDGLMRCFETFYRTYLARSAWPGSENLEARAAALLPVLFLARVDGKSPVEYLVRDDDRARVRRTARALIQSAPTNLGEIAEAWNRELDADG